MRLTKKDITNELNKINGFKVFTFNSYRALPHSCKDFIDHELISDKYLIKIEVKLYKDVLSEGQKETGAILEQLAKNRKGFEYIIITDKNYMEKIEYIHKLGRE